MIFGTYPSMDRELRLLLITALMDPENPDPRVVLAEWLAARRDPRVNQVQKHCETGSIHFRHYTLSGDGSGEDAPSVAFLVVQMLSQAVAVEFGCRCAEHVAHVVRRQWPKENRPEQLLHAIRECLQGNVTKKAVREANKAMVDLTDLDSPLPGSLDWTRKKQQRLYESMSAARSASSVALAVAPPSTKPDQWAPYICEGAMEAMTASGRALPERNWQRQELLHLLRDS